MAEQLGTAVLRLEVDDTALREGLEQARQAVESTTNQVATGGTRRTRTRRQSIATPLDGGLDERNLVNRFNLRSFTRELEGISGELQQVSGGRNLNLNTSWGRALQELGEIKQDLDSVRGGRTLKLRSSWQRALRELDEIANDIARTTRGGGSLPISGRLVDGSAVPGSPAARRDALRAEERIAALRIQGAREEERALQQSRSRRGQAISSAVIGGAFPLLFGQGAGASVGGLAGGLLGGLAGGAGGFAGSLVGTALGAQIDAAVQRLNTLGSALNDPIGKFQELAQAGLISSSALQKNIEALIASGREAEAAAQIQLDAARQFGDTSDLDELASATDAMNRSFAQLSVVLTKFVAGPLTDFLNKIAKTNQLISGRQIFQERIGGLGLNAQQRRNVLSEARANTRDNPAELYSEALAIVDRIYGKTQKQLSLEGALSDAVNRTTKLRSISYRLVDAEAFGNRQLVFDLKKKQVELERINKLQALGKRPAAAAVEQINSQAALETYRLVQAQGKFARDLFDSATKAVQSITRTLQDSTAQLLRLQSAPDQGLNRFLSPQAAGANVLASYDQLLPQFQAAANAAARSAAAQGNGLAAQEFSELAQRFTGRVSGFIEANGVRRVITSSPELINNSFADTSKFFQDFIDAQRTEQRLREDIAASNSELAQAQADLSSVTGQLVSPTTELVALMPALTQVIDTLSAKDWAVNVSVAADGSSRAYGDVVAGALSP